MELIIILCIIAGFIKGYTDTGDSFWRGFGAGLASNEKPKNSSYYISYRDRKTGLGIGTKIN